MLTRQSMLALAAAIVLGLFAVYIANAYLSGKAQQADLSGTTKVAVAAIPLDYGTDITADKVKFVDYPKASIPPGSFATPAQLLPNGQKRFALMTIGINEPLLATKISGAGQGASIAALLTEGMRAATVRIDDISGVAGFVQPNDSVDVLITRTPLGGSGQQLTDVLLQNVRVLAIDQEAKNSDGTPKLARSATFEVPPLDAQKLALGQKAGSLSLVLRKPGETNNPVVETVSMNDLRYNMYGGARYPAPATIGGFGAAAFSETASPPRRAAPPRRTVAARRAKPAPAPKPSVEVYRGTTSNEYKVGG